MKDVVRLNRSWIPQLRALWPVLLLLACMGFLWWRREIASHHQQEQLRIIYHLGEEILGAASGEEILNKITQALPRVLPVTGAKLYLYDRGTKTLTFVREPQAPGISLDSPAGLLETSAVACFHNHTKLSIPDTWRYRPARQVPLGHSPAPGGGNAVGFGTVPSRAAFGPRD